MQEMWKAGSSFSNPEDYREKGNRGQRGAGMRPVGPFLSRKTSTHKPEGAHPSTLSGQ